MRINNSWIGVVQNGSIAGNGRGMPLDRVEDGRIRQYFATIRENEIGYVNDVPAGNGNGNGVGVGVGGGGGGGGGILIGAVSGSNPITGNALFHNGNDGVRSDDAAEQHNRIEQNTLAANGNIGFDLGGNGISANDSGDAESGPNKLQNYPTLIAVTSELTIINTVDSKTANSVFPIEVDFYRAGSGSRRSSYWLGPDTFSLAPGAT